VTLEQVFPRFASSYAGDGLRADGKASSEDDGRFTASSDEPNVILRELRGVHALPVVSEVTPDTRRYGIVDIFRLGAYKQMVRIDALAVVAQMARDFSSFRGVTSGKKQRRDVHTGPSAFVGNRCVASNTVVEALLYAFVNLITEATLYGRFKPAEPFTIEGFSRQRVTVRELACVVTSTETGLVKLPVAAFDTARLFRALLLVMRAAKSFSLVGFTTSGDRTNTFHAGSAPLGGLKGVYH
jgi:hypothetical protein